jgi:hypothetical protein
LLVSDGPLAWWIHRLIGLMLGFVLVRSALAHLANPYFFLSSVYDYQLAGLHVGEAVALFLPHLEIVVGVCLIIGVWRHASMSLAAAMFCLFLIVQATAWLRGLSISCGCFGASGSEQISAGTLAYVGILAVAALGSALAFRK